MRAALQAALEEYRAAAADLPRRGDVFRLDEYQRVYRRYIAAINVLLAVAAAPDDEDVLSGPEPA